MVTVRYLLLFCLSTQLSWVLSQQCANKYTLTSSDTCISIMEKFFQNTWKLFPVYNGQTCSSLTLYSGLQICVPSPPPPPSGGQASTTVCDSYYQVKFGDTFCSVVYNYFGSDYNLYSQYNGNSKYLTIGQWLCLPKSPNSFYSTMAPTQLLPGLNLAFTVGLNLKANANPVSLPDRRNKFARYISLGFVDRPQNSTWDYPISVDWRAKGKLQPINNQGNCSSCWAYAAIAAIESAYAIINNIGIDFSEQQILDCTNIGCNGAWSTSALNYVSTVNLLPSSMYPKSATPGACKLNTQIWLALSGYANLVTRYEVVNFQGWMGLLIALQQQPVIANLHGSYPSFQNYVGGLYTDRTCTDSVIDHTVLLVGYNLQGGTPYWIIRNSWGTDWGEDGYMRMMMIGGRGICGIHAMPAVYPVVPNLFQCGGINPCGSGKCNSNLFGTTYTCTCPNQFIRVTNTDGTQTCTPIKVCTYLPTNPCGVGTCVDDMLGNYYCICPAGLSSGNRTDGSITCVPAVLGSQSILYTIQASDTCYLIANEFSVKISDLTLQNPGLNCNVLVVGATIKIPNSQGCSVSYSVNSLDTCQSVQTLFGLTPTTFTSLNPSLNCLNLIPAQQVCVAPGPFSGIPICTQYLVAYPGDTCQSIMTAANLTPLKFFGMNPGLYCDRLTIDNSTLTPGAEVCISGNPPGACSCSTGNYYYVQPSDTCARIISNYFNNLDHFKSLNCNMACVSSNLYVGQQLCRP